MEDTFIGGIRPGGLTDNREVRILICHILAAAGEPLSFDELTEAVLADGTANYFEFADAVAELKNLGCLDTFRSENGVSAYRLTGKGEDVAQKLAGSLPASIRDRAAANAKSMILRRRREEENLVLISRTDDGFLLRIEMKDIGTNLMELSLFLPTMEQAEAAKERFLEDPTASYKKVLEALAGEV